MDDEETARIEQIIDPVVRSHALELVDLDWRPARPRGVLRVFVDKPGGVGIGDCERMSRELGDVLDVSGYLRDPYDLEVSSPGLDRPLRKEREFRWAIGKPIRCWVAGGAEFHGTLTGVSSEQLLLERGADRIEVPRGQVTKARLDIAVPWTRRA